jgi:hypothetical protein
MPMYSVLLCSYGGMRRFVGYLGEDGRYVWASLVSALVSHRCTLSIYGSVWLLLSRISVR